MRAPKLFRRIADAARVLRGSARVLPPHEITAMRIQAKADAAAAIEPQIRAAAYNRAARDIIKRQTTDKWSAADKTGFEEMRQFSVSSPSGRFEGTARSPDDAEEAVVFHAMGLEGVRALEAGRPLYKAMIADWRREALESLERNRKRREAHAARKAREAREAATPENPIRFDRAKGIQALVSCLEDRASMIPGGLHEVEMLAVCAVAYDAGARAGGRQAEPIPHFLTYDLARKMCEAAAKASKIINGEEAEEDECVCMKNPGVMPCGIWVSFAYGAENLGARLSDQKPA